MSGNYERKYYKLVVLSKNAFIMIQEHWLEESVAYKIDRWGGRTVADSRTQYFFKMEREKWMSRTIEKLSEGTIYTVSYRCPTPVAHALVDAWLNNETSTVRINE